MKTRRWQQGAGSELLGARCLVMMVVVVVVAADVVTNSAYYILMASSSMDRAVYGWQAPLVVTSAIIKIYIEKRPENLGVKLPRQWCSRAAAGRYRVY